MKTILFARNKVISVLICPCPMNYNYSFFSYDNIIKVIAIFYNVSKPNGTYEKKCT
jgi:hypothetical protein